MEKQSLAPLWWLQKLQLRWHLSICEGCKRYQQQSNLLNEWLKQNRSVPTNLRLSDEAKNKMKTKLGV